MTSVPLNASRKLPFHSVHDVVHRGYARHNFDCGIDPLVGLILGYAMLSDAMTLNGFVSCAGMEWAVRD